MKRTIAVVQRKGRWSWRGFLLLDPDANPATPFAMPPMEIRREDGFASLTRAGLERKLKRAARRR